LVTGVVVITFTCDRGAYCWTFVGERRVLAGGDSGGVHFLSLELPASLGEL